MKKLMFWFLGYTKVKVSQENIRQFLNLANELGIMILELKSKKECVTLRIYTHNEKILLSAAKGKGLDYEIVSRNGIIEILKTYLHRAGLLTGVLLFFLALYLSPKFIWEINISGIERISEEQVCSILEEVGVHIGTFHPIVNRKEVHAYVLSKNKDISWIAVNFIGSSANVEILERDYAPKEEKNADVANIVAAKDGQIVETDVVCGRRLVKKGDIVKKGDVLVSGVYDTGKMGTRYVYSSAEVSAMVSDEFETQIPLSNYEKKYFDEITLKKTLKMFGKRINFYKNYSILEGNYDTISREEKIGFFGFDRVPVSVISEYVLPYEKVPVLLTETEALSRAQKEFFNKLILDSKYSDMISFEESYVIEDSVLIYKVSVDSIQNIAEISEYKINEN